MKKLTNNLLKIFSFIIIISFAISCNDKKNEDEHENRMNEDHTEMMDNHDTMHEDNHSTEHIMEDSTTTHMNEKMRQ